MSKEKPQTLDPKDITAIPINKLSTAFNKQGVVPDEGWFKEKSDALKQFASIVAEPKNWWQKVVSFAANIQASAAVGAAAGGTVGAFFGGIGAIPGALAGGLIGGVIGALTQPLTGFIKFADKNTALVVNAGKAALGIGGMATIGGLTGQSMPQLVKSLISWGDVLYDFNWDTPDSALWGAIKKEIDGLYGKAGSFLGASFARLILLGTIASPKIEVDVNGLALVYNELAEENKDELIRGVENFAKLGITAVKKIGFLIAYMTGRKAIIAYFKASPDLEKINPGLYKTITKDWGNEEDEKTTEKEVEDWRISTYIENKVEGVRTTFGDQIGDFAENFFEEFSDTLRDGLEDWADSLELVHNAI